MNRRAEIIADKPMLPTGGRCIRHVLCAMCLLVFAGALSGWNADPQAAPSAPLAPPPEHDVRRVGTEAEAPATPPFPPREIIRRFSAKEDQFCAARLNHGPRKALRIDELGEGRKPARRSV